MHALAAHGYHLLLRAAQVATWSAWRPLLAAVAVCLAGGARARSAPGGAIAVLAGWTALAPPTSWPPPPVERLGGLAVLVLAQAALPVRDRGWPLAITATLACIWICGPVPDRAALALCGAVCAGLLAGLSAARRLAEGDRGWATLAAALALAGSLHVAGASPHWALAALAPAGAAATLLGAPEAMAVLASTVVCLAAAALVASDRGRLWPVDVACCTPVLAWWLVRRLAAQAGWRSATASVSAALLCVSLAWMATRF